MTKYRLPKEFNVEVITTYKGKRVGKDFFDENPEIFQLYPDQSEVRKIRLEMMAETSPNMVSLIYVTESGIIKHLDHHPL